MDITERLKELHAEKRERSPLERLVKPEEPTEDEEKRKKEEGSTQGANNNLDITHYGRVIAGETESIEPATHTDAAAEGEQRGAGPAPEASEAEPTSPTSDEAVGPSGIGIVLDSGSSPGEVLGSGVKVFDLDELSGDSDRSERIRHVKLVTALVEKRQYGAATAAIQEMAKKWPEEPSGA